MTATSTAGSADVSPETATLCLGALLNQVPRSICFKDRDGRIVAVSRHLAEQCGATPEELVGRTKAGLYSDADTNAARATDELVMATHDPVVGKLHRVEWRDGRKGWVQTTRLPLYVDDTTVAGTIAIIDNVTDQQDVAHELEQTRRDLTMASRVAGMAEVATDVLHNIGNVLNSLNVSASVLTDGIRHSKAESLARIAALLHENASELAAFITTDPKGRRVPEFIATLARHMQAERERLQNEITALLRNLEHIRQIVTMQQACASVSGAVEALDPTDLVEDALRINVGALMRDNINVVRELHTVPRVRAERAKTLQILVNLIHNAKNALESTNRADREITIQIMPGAAGRVQIVIEDNGIGIAPETMARLFQRGFTTRVAGHGFGLHSARQAATDMDGTLTAKSAGLGKGASFTLDLPAWGARASEANPPT